MFQAIGNLLHMERRYEDAKGKCEKMQKEKDKLEDKLRGTSVTVDS